MNVKIENILRNLKGKIDVMHAIYEAITNSFDAEADKITLKFVKKNSLDVGLKIVDSFIIEDNGVGFTEKNIASFSEYLSDHKYDLGCKGIGRFTWLKVFRNIKIESELPDKLIEIDFNKEYNMEDSVNITEGNYSEIVTRITFSDYINYNKSALDLNLQEIKNMILDHFVLKFSIYKHENIKFQINLTDEETKETLNITLKDVVKTKKTKYSLTGRDNKKIEFSLVYCFIEDSKINTKVRLCANNRVVEEILPDYKSIKLPKETSGVFLVFSRYLDDRVNEERTNFILDKSSDFGNLEDPITYNMIIAETKTIIDNIILSSYPEVNEYNESTIKQVIDEYPYLRKYFDEDTSIIKRKSKMVKDAEKKYKTEKVEVKAQFIKMLESKKINTEQFSEIINKLSDISNRELAQYFIYRQQIIDGLKRLDDKGTGLEELLHNLFMGKNTQSSKSESKSLYSNNIWLLDDKFMSFNNIFSDKRIDSIVSEISRSNEEMGNIAERPDMTIFYANNTTVVVEFKGAAATKQKKLDSLGEINRNLGIVAKHFDNLNSQYGFVITDFTEGFIEYLRFTPYISEMFTNTEEPMFYYYNDKILDKNGKTTPTHIYIMSTKSLWMDANSRNKTFMDIIRNN